MFITDKTLIRFMIDTLRGRNFKIIENRETYKFSLLMPHSTTVFHIPKTESANTFRNLFLAASLSLNASEQDAEQAQIFLSKAVKLVNDIYLAAQSGL